MTEIKRSFSLRRANTPKRTDGYATGKLTHITFEKEEIVTKDKEGDMDTTDIERVVFHFAIDGTSGEPINIKHKCGSRLNGEKYVVKGKGRGKSEQKEYNKLTKTCLQLGFATDAEIKELTDDTMNAVMDKMDNAKNIEIRFKPTLDQKNNLFGIGLKTLEVVK